MPPVWADSAGRVEATEEIEPSAAAPAVSPALPRRPFDIAESLPVDVPPAKQSWNFAVLAIHQILVRVGWIFKTESVIMPAFLDAIAGPGWVRGCLPVLNRFGQSIPPVLFARRLEAMPKKKWMLAWWSLMMGLPFLGLAAIWHFAGSARAAWQAPLFLVLYTLFFAYTGLNSLVLGTLQGKLIESTRRGRLMGVSSLAGAVLASGFAIWLLGDWLDRPDGGFGLIFAFTGLMFVISAGCGLVLAERPRRESATHDQPQERSFVAAWQVVRTDRNFRKLAIVVLLFSGMQLIFPHYQALARERLDLTDSRMLEWVVTQNLATGIGGIILGALADRRGNRLALAVVLLSAAVAPVLAIALAHLDLEWGRKVFWVVFLPVGLTPLAMKTLTNYTLEIAPQVEHPRYLSTLNLCMAVPFLLSPAVGWLADVTSFELVFIGGSLLVLLGGLLAFRLVEPRHGRTAHHAVAAPLLEE